MILGVCTSWKVRYSFRDCFSKNRDPLCWYIFGSWTFWISTGDLSQSIIEFCLDFPEIDWDLGCRLVTWGQSTYRWFLANPMVWGSSWPEILHRSGRRKSPSSSLAWPANSYRSCIHLWDDHKNFEFSQGHKWWSCNYPSRINQISDRICGKKTFRYQDSMSYCNNYPQKL